MRCLDRGRQEVIHERRRGDIALIVVMNLLAHGDAIGFGQATVDLPFDDHRIDPRATIVESVEAAHLGRSGIHVDIDDTDIGAERVGEIRRIVVVDRFQAGLHARRHLVVGGPGEFGHGLEPLRVALHPEAVDIPFEIVIVHFEHIGGDHLRLGLDLATGHRGCGPGDRRRARAIGAQPVRGRVGIAFLDADTVRGKAEFGGDNLCVGRFVALALRFGAEPANAAARRVDADLGGIEHGDAEDIACAGRTGTADLGEEGDADAHELAGLAAFEGLALGLLLVTELGVVYRFHRLLERGLIVAGIVLPAERRRVWKLFAADQVLHAKFGRIDAELLSHHVHGALDTIGGLGHAERAAIGDTARRLIGVNAIDQHMGGWKIVRTADDAEQAGRPFGGIGAGVERAVVGDGVAPQPGDFAVLGSGDFDVHVEVARKRGGRKIFNPILDPFDRPSGDDRSDDRTNVSGIGSDFVAETAADIWRDDVDLVLGNFRNQGTDGANDVWRLERAP